MTEIENLQPASEKIYQNLMGFYRKDKTAMAPEEIKAEARNSLEEIGGSLLSLNKRAPVTGSISDDVAYLYAAATGVAPLDLGRQLREVYLLQDDRTRLHTEAGEALLLLHETAQGMPSYSSSLAIYGPELRSRVADIELKNERTLMIGALSLEGIMGMEAIAKESKLEVVDPEGVLTQEYCRQNNIEFTPSLLQDVQGSEDTTLILADHVFNLSTFLTKKPTELYADRLEGSLKTLERKLKHGGRMIVIDNASTLDYVGKLAEKAGLKIRESYEPQIIKNRVDVARWLSDNNLDVEQYTNLVGTKVLVLEK